MSATLDRIIEEAKALTPDELQQLRQTVDSLLTEARPGMTEDEFEQYLAAKGVITLPEPEADTGAEDDDWEPVEVTGQPLSEMIVEERR
jgi:ElaB/YqjD/DUF883 family membrane-anchored ribosome-binding protein